MTARRILVFAFSDVGHACLKTLLDRGENVVAVYTHEDNPKETWFPSVGALARSKGIPVRTPENLQSPEVAADVRALAPDLIFAFYYRSLIPNAILAAAKLGAYNMHGSLLPRFRGRAPVNWAVLEGETETGVTLHVMVEKADAGEIVDQQSVPIGPDDTAADVQKRVTAAAAAVLKRQIDGLKAGSAPRRAQDLSKGFYRGRRKPEDGEIRWERPAREIHNLVRAVSHPYPGAYTVFGGQKLFVWKSRVAADAPALKAGQIRLEGGTLLAGAGDGQAVELVSVQPDGGAEMSGADFGKRFLKEKP
jgi:methionyl-tRNA formyltransferase